MWILKETISESLISEHPLENPVVTVGRDGKCDIVLDGDEVSRTHAELRASQEFVLVRDLESANGVFVGEAKIAGEREVHPGEIIVIGKHHLTLIRRAGTKEFQDKTIIENPNGVLQVRLRQAVFQPDEPQPAEEKTQKMSQSDLNEESESEPLPTASRPFLKQASGKGAFVISSSEFVIGRGVDCDLAIKGEGVSRQHAKIVWRKNQHYIYDMESANGVFVGGIKTRGVALVSGDFVRVGDETFQYIDPKNPPDASRQAPTATAKNRGTRVKRLLIAGAVLILIAVAVIFFMANRT